MDAGNPFTLLFHVLEEGEELHDAAMQIGNILCNTLTTVTSFVFQLRVNIDVRLSGSRGPNVVVSALSTLESEVSRKDYARLFSRLVFFS